MHVPVSSQKNRRTRPFAAEGKRRWLVEYRPRVWRWYLVRGCVVLALVVAFGVALMFLTGCTTYNTVEGNRHDWPTFYTDLEGNRQLLDGRGNIYYTDREGRRQILSDGMISYTDREGNRQFLPREGRIAYYTDREGNRRIVPTERDGRGGRRIDLERLERERDPEDEAGMLLVLREARRRAQESERRATVERETRRRHVEAYRRALSGYDAEWESLSPSRRSEIIEADREQGRREVLEVLREAFEDAARSRGRD